ncbi:MAG: NTP transferase domain-containing protein, partial [Sphaerochaetaceae bacterium]
VSKLLLSYQGKPLLAHALEASLEGSSRVIIVTGSWRQAIEAVIAPYKQQFPEKLIIVHNAHPERGQFYSTQIGVSYLSPETHFFLALADLPLIKGDHYRQLAKELNGWEGVRPFYKGNPGHPVLCCKTLAKALLEAPFSTSVHQIIEGRRIKPFLSEDPAWTTDIDTPESYRHFINHWDSSG